MSTTISSPPEAAQSIPLYQRALSFPVFMAAIFATLIYFFIPQSMADPDIWWHLRNAQLQIATHSFIRYDVYSFTALGSPWMNHEWLAELPFYFGWRLLGAKGLFLVATVAIESILLGVFYLAYRKSRDIKSALIVSPIAGILATVSYGPRTLLFGWICLIIELIILERINENRSAMWGLPFLFLVWVNTHGSWLIGIVILVIFVACGCIRINVGSIEGPAWSPLQRRKLAIVSTLSIGALFINPYGWHLVYYPFDLAFRQKLNISNVEEWYTLDFHSVRGKVLLFSIAALCLLQVLRPRKWAPYELALLFIGVYASFTYSRFLFLAAILVMPLLAKSIYGLSPYRPHKNRPALNALILLALMPSVVRHTPDEAHILSSQNRKFPDHAMSYLRDFHPKGAVFTDYLWGGYLIWHARQISVFVDSRVDIFEYNGTFKDYLDATKLKNTLFVLDKYRIRYVFFQRDTPLVYFLQHTGEWKVQYQDDSSVLLERAGDSDVPPEIS